MASFQSLQSFVFTRLQLNRLDKNDYTNTLGTKGSSLSLRRLQTWPGSLSAAHTHSHTHTPHGPSIPSSTCDSLLSLYGSTPWASMGQSCQSCLLQNWILIKNIDFLLCKIAARKDFSPPFNAINWGRGWEGCDTKEQNRFQI